MQFKEWLLFEEKRSAIMYHGTSMAAWPDIKQNGLDPFPNNKTWEDDPGIGWNVPSRASYGGVYLTQNLITATGSAFRTAKKTNSKQLLLAIETDPRTLIADEDSVTFAAKNVPIPGLLTTEYSASDLYIAFMILKNPQYIQNMKFPGKIAQWQQYVESARKKYVEEAWNTLAYKLSDDYKNNEVLQRQVSKYLYDTGFEAALTRLAAHANHDSRDYAFSSYDRGTDQHIKWPTKQEGELIYKNFIDKLTYLMRKLADPQHSKSMMHSSRFMRKIGFDGPNKIVYAAIIERRPYTTQDGDERDRDALKRIYGEPPADLINQWNQRLGPWQDDA